MSRIILRNQSELIEQMRRRMRDPDGSRWTDGEIYSALSDSLSEWYSRVAVPQVYTITGGWVTGQSDYVLPSYIKGDIQPQQRRHTDSYLYQFQVPSDQDQWVDVNNFQVWPNTSGGLTLHLGRAPDAGDGRIIWWGRNGSLPTAIPTLTSGITAGDTTATITTTLSLPENGYVKLDTEWIGYSGIQDTTTSNQKDLLNLTRDVAGQSGGAVAHSAAIDVEWGVAAHREDLYTQLYDATRAELHALYITAAAESERAHHERMTMYYREKADTYWRGYIPNRPTKLKLSRSTSGDLGSENFYQVTI